MSKSSNARRKGLAVLATSALVAGASFAGAGSAHAVADFKFKRLGGTDRYETAALVADEFAATNKTVILANGEPGNYADALSANTLAGELNAPILLTRKDKTPKFTLDQLKDDAVTDIYVVGGTGVVSAAQVSSLEGMGYKVTRIAGSDRFFTNAEIIKKNGAAKGNTGLIATGFNFPDALAAGPFSYQGHPLGLSATNNIEDAVVDALKGAGVTKVLIFGGESVVGPAVVTKLAANGITVEKRFAGADRSDTSEQAAEYAIANLGFSKKHLGVASGYAEGFGADALAGGPLEGKEVAPMLVTRDVNNPDDVVDYMKAHADTLETGHLFGGPGAISVAAQDAMEKAAQSVTSAVALPELTTAQVINTVTSGSASPTNPKGTVIRYNFDEAFATQAASKFFATLGDGTRFTGSTVVASTSNSVDVRFTDIDETAEATALTVATVDDGAVSQSDGDTNPEGDAPLGATTGGGTVNLPAGITKAPDLLSISRVGDTASGAGTVVDFTFDEAANTQDPAVAGDFQIHLLDNTVYSSTAANTPQAGDGPSGENNKGGDGTTTITVEFTQDFTAAQVARGTVAEGAVSEASDNESPVNGSDANELQAAPLSNNGNTTAPDLVSVELRPDTDTDGTGPDTDVDQALFTFDQPVVTATVTAGSFALYTADGSKTTGTAAEVNTANRTQVLVDFGTTGTVRAVGGNVLAGAVFGDNAQGNTRDEEGVANTDTGASQTAGKTSGPDLTGVKLAKETDTFGNVTGTDATYTFDEDVNADVDTKFHLFLANGTKVTAASCAFGTTEATDNTVVCEFNGVTGDIDREFDAVLGTVDVAAVTAEDGLPSNPEGAEATTR